MSINTLGTADYKEEQLMKRTKKDLVARLLEIDKTLDKLNDAYKFEPSTSAYQWETLQAMRDIVHQ